MTQARAREGLRARRSSWLAAGTALAIVSVLALVAGFQGRPVFGTPLWTIKEIPPAPSASAPAPPEMPANPTAPAVGSNVLVVITVAVGALIALALLALIVRALWRMWLARRPPIRRETAVLDGAAVEPEGVIDPGAVRRSVDAALDSFDEHRHASDAIVAAWLTLESTVGSAGIRRGQSETAAEYVSRIVSRRTASRADIAVVLAAYERVRFGDGTAGAAERARVRDALVNIRREWQ